MSIESDSRRHVPAGYQSLVPYLISSDAPALIAFLQKVFAAEQRDYVQTPDGKVMHASYCIDDCMIELSGGSEEFPPMPASLHIYVPDTDATFQKAVAAGAKVLREPADQFYGERGASIQDPTGNHWHLATKTEDLTKEEMDARTAEFLGKK